LLTLMTALIPPNACGTCGDSEGSVTSDESAASSLQLCPQSTSTSSGPSRRAPVAARGPTMKSLVDIKRLAEVLSDERGRVGVAGPASQSCSTVPRPSFPPAAVPRRSVPCRTRRSSARRRTQAISAPFTGYDDGGAVVVPQGAGERQATTASANASRCRHSHATVFHREPADALQQCPCPAFRDRSARFDSTSFGDASDDRLSRHRLGVAEECSEAIPAIPASHLGHRWEVSMRARL